MRKLNLLVIFLTAFVFNTMAREEVQEIIPIMEESVLVIEETFVVEEEPLLLVHPISDELVISSFEPTTRPRRTGLGDNKLAFYEGGLFQHLAIGINAGSYGFGFEVNTPIIPHIKARAGLNFIRFGLPMIRDVEFDYTSGITGERSTGVGDINPDISFFNGRLLFDFLPSKKGIFAFTAGAFVGNNRVALSGAGYEMINGMRGDRLINEEIDFGGNIIVFTDENGEVDAELRLGNIVKPYLGITLGRAIPKHRVGFKFEIGALYHGAFRLTSSGATGEAVREANTTVNLDMLLDELPSGVARLLNFWPMISFQLTYKLW